MRGRLIPALLALGCAGEPDCALLHTECTPLYEPTYDQVYGNTVIRSCQLAGCHGGLSAAGDLALGRSATEAYDELLDRGAVLPDDPACSPMFVEIQAGRMPPGRPLSAAEQCVIQHWLEDGAPP